MKLIQIAFQIGLSILKLDKNKLGLPFNFLITTCMLLRFGDSHKNFLDQVPKVKGLKDWPLTYNEKGYVYPLASILSWFPFLCHFCIYRQLTANWTLKPSDTHLWRSTGFRVLEEYYNQVGQDKIIQVQQYKYHKKEEK